jgi:hypothetical protein
MNLEDVKYKLTKTSEINCDRCNGTGKVQTKPAWIDLLILFPLIVMLLIGLIVLMLSWTR